MLTLKIRAGLITAIILALSSCLQTRLSTPAISPELKRLAELNSKPLNLVLKISPSGDSLGHQYLLIMIPFGRITNYSLFDLLHQSALRDLSLAGYQPQILSNANIDLSLLPPHTLVLELKDLQLTAYDYLFFRRIYCRIKLLARLYEMPGHLKRAWETDYDEGFTKAFAFEKELQYALESSMQKAMQLTLKKMGLTR